MQTQTVYLTDFHDEAKAQWLANYLDPQAPMDTVRMSNTECLPRYNGLDGFPHATNEEYLRTMIRSEPITYEVRYKVGTWAGGNQGTGGAVGPSEGPRADEAFRKGMEQKQTLDFWGGSNNAAAAVRGRTTRSSASTPAKPPRVRETMRALALRPAVDDDAAAARGEWQRDLCAIYDGSLILPRDPDADEAQAIAAEQSLYARVIRDKAMGEDPDELGRFATSPLRAANLDLCERLGDARGRARALRGRRPVAGPSAATRGVPRAPREQRAGRARGRGRPTTSTRRSPRSRAAARVLAPGRPVPRRRGLARRWLRCAPRTRRLRTSSPPPRTARAALGRVRG